MKAPSDPLMLEALAVAAAAAAAFLASGSCARALRRGFALLRVFAGKPWRSIGACALLAALGSAAVAHFVHWPEPRIHDEFSYLLAADTFARGRLANPTHPLWEHFETFHVLQHPTYASKFPPAQGLALAAGQVLGGHPLVGVWLGAALMCGAIVWALYGWLPPRWALLGGLVAVARFGVATYWSQSYWGGAVAAAGGALVFGALPRLVRGGRARDGALLGAGLVVLATSRPYEGLVTALPVAVALAVWIARARGRAGRPLAALSLVVAAAALWLGQYHRAVTGDPLRMPFVAHDEAYAVVPRFLGMDLPPTPRFHNETMEEFWAVWTVNEYTRQSSPEGFALEVGERWRQFWEFFLSTTLSVPLLFGRRLLRNRWMRLAGITCVAVLGASLAPTYHWPHYWAPITCPLLIFVVGCLRRTSVWSWRGRPVGKALTAGLLLVVFAQAAGQAVTRGRPVWGFEQRRAGLLRELELAGGEHLVLVRYGKNHSTQDEWVYNGADIDSQRVVFARDLGAARNAALLSYYDARKVWTLDVGAERDAPILAAQAR